MVRKISIHILHLRNYDLRDSHHYLTGRLASSSFYTRVGDSVLVDDSCNVS